MAVDQQQVAAGAPGFLSRVTLRREQMEALVPFLVLAAVLMLAKLG